MPDWPAHFPENRAVSALVPYARNARTHSDAQIGQVAASIREWGWTSPVLIDEAGTIIAGHARVLAAQALKLAEIPVIVARDWSEAQKRAYVIADNQLALNAGWDADILKIEISDLKGLDFDLELLGFDIESLAELLKPGTEGLTEPDDVPDAPVIPISASGDLWLLGEHRLLCGDATEGEDHDRVIGADFINLVLTDPPYGVGVAYSTFQDNEATVAELVPKFMPLVQRHLCALLTPGTPSMWLYPRPTWLLAWIHPAPISSGPWGFNGLNPVLAYGKDPYLAAGQGRRLDHLVQVSDRQQVGGHPTPKPIEVWKWLLERGSISRTDHILDPFCGSGTSIIAAEMTGRTCHALEIAPTYVDVSVLRWQAFTGNEARLEATGETFAEVAAARTKEAA